MTSAEHFDIVLVGAGISSLGLAHHLQEQCSSKSFVILESKDTFGGTWDTHTYPGVRSDSDLYTFGYRFKPWTGAPVASGEQILAYMQEVIEEDNLGPRIRFNHEIIKASWSSSSQMWTLQVKRKDQSQPHEVTCNFFIWSGGYYDHSEGYTPEWDGLGDFEGQIVHPQNWPEDFDYLDKKVVVIGSGATAATLIPNICDACSHVTMLQRSPTYFWTGENRNELADRLRRLEIPESWIHEIVRRDLLETQRTIQQAASAFPDMVKEELLKVVRENVGEELTRTHFTPSYRPWQQRLAYVPDADLFQAIKDGKADVVTDQIDRFVPEGIALASGKTIGADIVITATGFNLSPVGGIVVEVDGQVVPVSNTFTYRGIMLSGLPNFAMMFGYLRTSWTMRVDLVGDYLCRLLNHMEARGHKSVTPTLRQEDDNMAANRWISEEEFNPGYMNRGADLMPKTGDRDPWVFSPDYYTEKDLLPSYSLNDGVLKFI